MNEVAARRHDVAIVGGGPVGLLLGCLVAARGLDVVVLDRRATPSGSSRAIGIHPPGLRVLDAAGIGEAVRERAATIREGVVSCEGRLLGRMAFREPVRSLPQHETEALLEARLASLAPGALRRGVAVTGWRDRGTHVELAIAPPAPPGPAPPGPAPAPRSNGTGFARSSRVQARFRGPNPVPSEVVEEVAGRGGVIAATYLVGADGVRSTVREVAGIRWRERRGRAEYVMGDSDDTTDATTTALLHFEPSGVVESFPLPGRRRRWVAWVRRPPAPLDAGALATIVSARTGASVDLVSASEPSAFTARQHLAARFATGRIALVGDAAHEVSPIGGQGMNLGWLDAQHLARDLAGGIAEGGVLDAFVAYDRVRRSAAARAIRQARFNMRMGGPAAGVRLRARNAAVRALAVPPFRAVLAAAFTMRWL